jgi:hypothetical protein
MALRYALSIRGSMERAPGQNLGAGLGLFGLALRRLRVKAGTRQAHVAMWGQDGSAGVELAPAVASASPYSVLPADSSGRGFSRRCVGPNLGGIGNKNTVL